MRCYVSTQHTHDSRYNNIERVILCSVFIGAMRAFWDSWRALNGFPNRTYLFRLTLDLWTFTEQFALSVLEPLIFADLDFGN